MGNCYRAALGKLLDGDIESDIIFFGIDCFGSGSSDEIKWLSTNPKKKFFKEMEAVLENNRYVDCACSIGDGSYLVREIYSRQGTLVL